MLALNYDYESCIRSSEKVAWTIDDVMAPGTQLDFARPFLPAALAGSQRLAFLSDAETLKLNQINGHAYANLFGFVEEFIIATAVQHAQAEMFGDHSAIRALLRFAEEEVKHQQLFNRYVAAFDRDFGHKCEVLASAAEVAGVVLSKSPLAVMMITLHLEIMTQAHYVECMKDDVGIDPLFARLFKFHWLEESQHARIDALELDKMLEHASHEQIQTAFADYLDLIGAVDGLLAAQADMDARALAGAIRRTFSTEDKAALVASQHAGYRRTFLVYGMNHATFTADLESIWPEGAMRVREKAAQLS